MSKAKLKSKKTAVPPRKEPIVIDAAKGLVFANEKDLYTHFLNPIQTMEKEFLSLRNKSDFPEEEFADFEDYLDEALEDPDEVWRDTETFKDLVLHHFVRKFEDDQGEFTYIACVYVYEQIPTFIFLHFPTQDPSLVENYKRGDLIFDRSFAEVESGAIEGDALTEGDPLAVGLFRAMLKVRSEKDIPQGEFYKYAHHREESIEGADEIWRSADFKGNNLVSFIKEFPDSESKDLVYIVVTLEEPGAQVHALLFSFPSTDRTLVERYRHGENLQAEEVIQESSH
jgi:hypothetical protein